MNILHASSSGTRCGTEPLKPGTGARVIPTTFHPWRRSLLVQMRKTLPTSQCTCLDHVGHPKECYLPSDGWALAAGPTLHTDCALSAPTSTTVHYHHFPSHLLLWLGSAWFAHAWEVTLLGWHFAFGSRALLQVGRPATFRADSCLPVCFTTDTWALALPHPHSRPQHTHYWVEAASTMRPALLKASCTLK